MLYNRFFRFRRLSIILSFLIFFFITKHFYSNPRKNVNHLVRSFDRPIQARQFKQKLVEINDRQPSFKMYIYEGYNISSDRNHAQMKLLDNIKLHDKCQQNSKLIVIDIGASLGQFGLYAAACGCQVYMFEVNPMKLSLLQASIKLNSFQSRITVFLKAVTDLPSNRKIFMSLKSSKDIRDQSDVYSVETINLNQLNFSSDIYLFRVNVKGYEIHVFRGSEKLFRHNLVHHVLFQYTPIGTDRVIKNDLLAYMRDILGGRKFYALHPKQAIIYGPLYNEDIDQFYMQHQAENLERDVYVLFQDEEMNIDSKIYEFQTSFQ